MVTINDIKSDIAAIESELTSPKWSEGTLADVQEQIRILSLKVQKIIEILLAHDPTIGETEILG